METFEWGWKGVWAFVGILLTGAVIVRPLIEVYWGLFKKKPKPETPPTA